MCVLGGWVKHFDGYLWDVSRECIKCNKCNVGLCVYVHVCVFPQCVWLSKMWTDTLVHL